MYDFILQYMIYLQWIWWEWGEKTRNIYKRKTRKNPRLVALPSPPASIKLAADCFPGRKNRKQAGPTLGWTGILIYRDKRKGVGARYGLIQAGNMIFYTYEFLRSSTKADWDTAHDVCGTGPERLHPG